MKYIKRGAIAVGAVLVAGAGIYAYKTGKLDGIIDKIKNGKKSTKKVLAGDLGGVDSISLPLTERTGPSLSPSESIIGRNPQKHTYNCKDTALAVCMAHNGHGNMVAGDKSFQGNLHAFIADRFENVGEDTVHSVSADSSNAHERVTKQILRKCKDGDCGIVGVTWDKKYLKAGAAEDSSVIGHAFNFFVENGKVLFKDAQPDPPREDVASMYFKRIDPNKEIEWVAINDDLKAKKGALEKSMHRE